MSKQEDSRVILNELIEHVILMHHEAKRVAYQLERTLSKELQTLDTLINGPAKRAYLKRVRDSEGDDYKPDVCEEAETIRNILLKILQQEKHKDVTKLHIFLKEHKTYITLKTGQTVGELNSDGLLNLCMHPKRPTTYLLSKSGEQEDLTGFLCCLYSGMDLYQGILEKLVEQYIFVENGYNIQIGNSFYQQLLKIDRELGYIKEDVAAYIATSDQRFSGITAVIGNRINQEITVNEAEVDILDHIRKFKKKGEAFRHYSHFKKMIYGKIRNLEGKTVSNSTVDRVLKRLDINTKEKFNKFYAKL